MNKTLLIVPLALLLPVAAHAAWWNPSDWFKAHPEVPVDTAVDLPTVQEEVEPTPVATTTIKTVTKYVTDPNLALQVTALTQENKGQGELIVQLQAQIASLAADKQSYVTKLNQCNSTLSDQATVSPQSSADQARQEKLEELDANIRSLFKRVVDTIHRSDEITKYELPGKIKEVNEYLTGYRIIDPAMTHSNLDPQRATLDSFVELRDYIETYIKYRN